MSVACCTGRGLCDGPIPRPGESYRVCVCVCVIKRNNKTLCTTMGRLKRMAPKNKTTVMLNRSKLIEIHSKICIVDTQHRITEFVLVLSNMKHDCQTCNTSPSRLHFSVIVAENKFIVVWFWRVDKQNCVTSLCQLLSDYKYILTATSHHVLVSVARPCVAVSVSLAESLIVFCLDRHCQLRARISFCSVTLLLFVFIV